MINVKNEKGSALILVLFLVVLIGLLISPLLLSTRQGAVQTARGENSELANYTSESGTIIFRRALLEAAKLHMSMGPNQINSIVDKINALNISVNGSSPVLQPLENKGANVYSQKSVGTYGNGLNSQKKEISVQFTAIPSGNVILGPVDGGIPNGVAIFGTDAVSNTSNTDALKDQFEKVAGGQVTPSAVSKPAFADTYTKYFNKQMATKPSVMTPTSAYDVSTVSTKVRVPYPSPAHTIDYPMTTSETYSNSNSKIIINGDLVAGKDISFPEYIDELEIFGNVIAGEHILFGKYVNKVTVHGNMIAGKQIRFSAAGAANITVSGTMSSETGIVIDGSIDTMNVSSSILSNGATSFNYIRSLTVGSASSSGSISSQAGINFNGSIGQLTMPNGSINAVGNIVFNDITDASITGSISSQTAILFNGQTGNFVLTGSGNILGANSLRFNGYVTNINTTGSLAANDIGFAGIASFKVGGTLFAVNNLLFTQYISDLSVINSIYAKTIDFNNNQADIGKLTVGGSLLAMTKIDFPYINGLMVKSFIGSNDKITFREGITANPKPIIGGITTADKIDFKSWINQPAILIDYWPPGSTGSSGSVPSIIFTTFSTQ